MLGDLSEGKRIRKGVASINLDSVPDKLRFALGQEAFAGGLVGEVDN